jgi:tetratricopeptide (TPR) repeat protein
MGKIKISRKDLKRDELKDFGARLYETYQRHQTAIWVAVGVVVVLWAVIWLWRGHAERGTVEAHNRLAVSLGWYRAALAATDPRELLGNMQRSVEQCDVLLKRNAGSKLARQGMLIKGNALFIMERFDAAIRQFNEFRETTGDPDDLAVAHIALGYCHVNKFFKSGMRDDALATQALEHYRQARLKAHSSYLKRQAMIGEGRLFEVVGNLDQAIIAYKEVVDEAAGLKESEKERYGDDSEAAKMAGLLLPPISDMFGAEKVAQLQIDRLKALIEAGEITAAVERSVPPPEDEASAELPGPPVELSGPAAPAVQESSPEH